MRRCSRRDLAMNFFGFFTFLIVLSVSSSVGGKVQHLIEITVVAVRGWQRIVWLLRSLHLRFSILRAVDCRGGGPSCSVHNEHRERVNQVVVDTLVHTVFLSFFLSLVSYYWTPTEFRFSFWGESFDCFFLFSSLESMEMMILMIRFPFVFFLSFFLSSSSWSCCCCPPHK